MDVQVVPRSHCPDLVENIFRASRPRYGVYDHVRIRQHMMHRLSHCVGHMFGVLERHRPRQSDGQIRKVAIARPPDAARSTSRTPSTFLTASII